MPTDPLKGQKAYKGKSSGNAKQMTKGKRLQKFMKRKVKATHEYHVDKTIGDPKG